ncbi:MAG: prolyl oligopeptidase family serine peptidase [Bacteroidetes bacterium]|nr:prolyl oligopeptidase family serine peptidase [Bacteroidota bacterium]MCX7907371.1 prolyl oligopeptidase family serine peptidase [Bacteroidota bacterium]MDW8138365.1 prolyl oligopeptidase family serine peptidase [Bacteroidota bacterium]
MGRVGLSLLLGLGSALAGWAQRTHKPWTIEDVIQQESITGFDISPDGRAVVWAKRYADPKKDRHVTDLYLTRLPEGGSVQLTRGGHDDAAARFSPDGRWIAFLSARRAEELKEGRQIWLIRPDGGEPWPISNHEGGVRAFAWRDSLRIVFLAREEPTLRERQLKERKDDAQVVEDPEFWPPVRLFELDIRTRNVRRLTENTDQILEFALSPDGRYIVTSHNQSPHYAADARQQPRQFLYDLVSGERIEIFAERYLDPGNFQWTPDARGFYATDTRASDPQWEGAGIEELYYFDLSTRTHLKVPLAWDWGLGSFGVVVPTPQGVLVQLANGTTNRLAHYVRTPSGWERRWVSIADTSLSPDHLGGVVLGPDGRTIVLAHSRANRPTQYFWGRLEGESIVGVRELVRLNAHLRERRIAQTEVFRWRGSRNRTIEGILYYPHDYRPGRRYPLIVLIHGGPASVDLDAWRESWAGYPNLLAQRGAFVLRPNYHGSSNYGLEFVESIKGRYYEYELPDIRRGVEALIQRGLVHSDSLGVMGWSNGAILTIGLTVEYPTLFKAAAPGAGNVNWISDYGNCSFGVRFDESYFKGNPWNNLKHYLEKSPLFRLDRVVTPTLICFGTEDRAVPTEQGWQHYRALQQLGKAPVRFVLFPGAEHSLVRLSHQRRKMEEELAWFAQYLFGRYDKPNPAYKADSPLGELLRRAQIARTDGLYGIRLADGTLVPEFVKADSFWVSRFEITRAQYRAFRPDYAYPAGTDNYPANGISLQEAQAYARWLAEKLGQPVRLPTVAEFEALERIAQDKRAQENTLDFWAGYTPNPDEVQLLQRQLQELPRADALLLEVGSRPGAGPMLLFDIGGNVAEWCLDAQGEGVVRGGAAVLPADPKASYRPPAAAYVGFRLVRAKP